MPYALEPPRELPRDPAARLVAARPRARRGVGARLGARRRDGGAAVRDDDARRPPRVAERDRRLARRDRGRARLARRPLGALLRDERPRRAGARAGRASRRTGASSRGCATSGRRSPAGSSARTPRSRSRDETLAACAEPPPSLASAPRPRGRGRRRRARRVARSARASPSGSPRGALDERHAARARRPPRRRRARARPRRADATVAHNARSNMNNGVGRAARRRARPAASRSAPTGSAPTCSRSRAPPSSGCARTTSAPAPAGRSRALAESARLAGALFGEPLLGTLEPGAPADLVVLDYDAPTPLDAASFAGHWIFGLSSRHVRDVMVAGEWVVRDRRARPASTSGELAADAPRAGRAAVAPPRRARRRTPTSRKEASLHGAASRSISRTSTRSATAWTTRSSPSSAGFEAVWQAESRLVREATVPMAAFAAVTERIGIGAGVVNTWTRNVGLLAATFSTLDDLAPGPDQARHRRVVGAARVEGRRRTGATPLALHARDGRGDAPPARDGARHLPRRVRPPRRRRDRHRPRRPLAEARADLRRRDRR